MKSTWRLRLAAVTALTLALAGCASNDGTEDEAPAAEESEDGGGEQTEAQDDGDGVAAGEQGAGDVASAETIRAAITGDESTLNPVSYVTGFPGWNLLMLQYDSLMQIDVDGVPQPWLAESVEASEDGLSYDVELVEGVTWHDGEALDAEDVVFTFEYFPDSDSSRFSRAVAPVASVEASGERSVTFTLNEPAPAFELSVLSDVPIIPEHVWSEIEDPTTAGIEANVGTGPYMLTDYAPEQSYTLEANPDYFRGAPAVDQLVLVQFADDTGTLAAIRSGEVDVIFDRIAPEQVDLLDQQDPIEIVQGPEYTTQLLYYDTSKAPWNDPAVRQAISLAMDRQDMVDTVYLGSATVGSPGWIHPDQVTYDPSVEASTDVDQANALLEDAGHTDSDDDGIREVDGEPMSYELVTPSGDALRLRLAELAAEMLSDIGIQAQVSSVEQGTWEEAVWPGFDVTQGRNYDLAMWGWSAPVQADATRIGSLVHSDPAIGSLNLTGYSNPDMDELAEQLSVEGDPQVQAELISQMQQLFAESLPFVTLLYPDGAYAYDSSVYDAWSFVTGQGIVTKLSMLPADARP